VDGFTLIADPTRRRILDLLRASDRDVGALVESLELPQPLVSKHLRCLRETGAVTPRVVGKRRVYRLAADPLPEVLAWVGPFHRGWEAGLDRLERALDLDRSMELGDGGAGPAGERTDAR
jgi:DNA-binding transcriptional ArsR family regulator